MYDSDASVSGAVVDAADSVWVFGSEYVLDCGVAASDAELAVDAVIAVADW